MLQIRWCSPPHQCSLNQCSLDHSKHFCVSGPFPHKTPSNLLYYGVQITGHTSSLWNVTEWNEMEWNGRNGNSSWIVHALSTVNWERELLFLIKPNTMCENPTQTGDYGKLLRQRQAAYGSC